MIVKYNNYLILTTLSKSNIYSHCLTTKRRIIAILFPSITVYLSCKIIDENTVIFLRIDSDFNTITIIEKQILGDMEINVDDEKYNSFIDKCYNYFRNKPC